MIAVVKPASASCSDHRFFNAASIPGRTAGVANNRGITKPMSGLGLAVGVTAGDRRPGDQERVMPDVAVVVATPFRVVPST